MTEQTFGHQLLPKSLVHLFAFVDAGVLSDVDLFVVDAMERHFGSMPETLSLMAAMTNRAVRHRHSCVVTRGWPQSSARGDDDAEAIASLIDAWPTEKDIERVLKESSQVSCIEPGSDDEPTTPLVFDGDRLYFERQWRLERDVAVYLSTAMVNTIELDPTAIQEMKVRLGESDQFEAAINALSHTVSTITGGPGTGKTHTIGAMLMALQLPFGEIAVAAPTGKAATRISASLGNELSNIAGVESADIPKAVTLHRLLKMRPGVAPRMNKNNPLAASLIVVDECSMMDLTTMSRLIDALPKDAQLVLTGDPDQLASVEMGTVLSDIVGEVVERTVENRPWNRTLTTARRFHGDSGIALLADAVRQGDSDRVVGLLEEDRSDIHFLKVEKDDTSEKTLRPVLDRAKKQAAELVEAAKSFHGETQDAGELLELATSFKILCAHHQGPRSVAWFDRIIERSLNSLVGQRRADGGYIGRPVLVTKNDYLHGVMNGDVGVTIRGRLGDLSIVIDDPLEPKGVPASFAGDLRSWWAMTVHKSQGSEFDELVVSLPEEGLLLSRELLYTAITRAKRDLTIVGSVDAVRRAVDNRIERASGLGAQIMARRS